MSIVQVFDPAMCCSTGVCGPSVDPSLTRFAADLDWVKNQGATVTRFNLAQQPADFAADPDVKSALEVSFDGALPLIKVDGAVKSKGRYPDRAELAAWIGIKAPEPSIYSESVAELVAIGAAIASNCEPCLKFHFDKARKLGVSKDDMLQAVKTAQAVKDAPSKSISDLAVKILSSPDSSKHTARFTAVGSGSCCGGSNSDKASDCC